MAKRDKKDVKRQMEGKQDEKRARAQVAPSAARASKADKREVSAAMFDPQSMNVVRDDGFSLVTAEDYVTFRLKPQIIFYQELSPWLNRLSSWLQVTSYLLTAVTTALALIGREAFVPIPIALIALITAVSDFEQLTSRLRNVNQCKMALENLLIWWESLSMVEKRLPVNKEYLVKVAEDNTNAEVSAFIKSAARLGKPRLDSEDEEDKDSKKKAE